MEKVVIPKMVAQVIEKIYTERKLHDEKGEFAYKLFAILDAITDNSALEKWANECDNINLLTHAILYGYEAEKTPEEIVAHRYQEAKKIQRETDSHYIEFYNDGFAEAIEFITDILEIKIKGINA